MDAMTRRVGVMDFSLYEKLIRECATRPEVRQVHLHGFGEPLADKRIAEKVSLAKRLGIRQTYIVTTGSLLTEAKAAALIDAGLDSIKFSFYGMTTESYESVHKGLKFQKIVDNITAFFRIRDERRARNPSVRFQFSSGLAPESDLRRFTDYWRPFMDRDRNDQFLVTGLHNWAGGKDYTQVRMPESDRLCSWPFRDIQILWDGRVVPCVFDYDGRHVLGDVSTETIETVWRSPAYEAFRQVWRERRSYSIPLCKKCDEPEGTFQPRALPKQHQPPRRHVVSHPVVAAFRTRFGRLF